MIERAWGRFRAWLDRTGWRPAHYLLLALVNAHLLTSGTRAGQHDWRYVFYPWADALRETVLRYHQLPWWNPWAISGEPLFADPQAPVLVPDTLLVLAFGTVVGLKLVLFLYACVGYEGSRFLCRHLFGDSRFVQAVSVLPALLPPLALHWGEGHMVFVVFLLFPWLLALSLTWQESTARAGGLGVIVAWHLLSYVHYSVIISLTICGPIAALGFARTIRSPRTWLRAAIVASTILGLAYLRLSLTLGLLQHFPRLEKSHYPIVLPLKDAIRSLIVPLQDRRITVGVAGLHWWELDSYVGVIALGLAIHAMSTRRLVGYLLVGGALLCLVLAWNNRTPPFPSYYLHRIRPWDHMVVITRWRLYAVYLLLLAAVCGLVAVHRDWPRLAGILALLAMADLGGNYAYGYRGAFTQVQPPSLGFEAPPVTVKDTDEQTWSDERQNRVSMGAQCSVLGYGYHFPARTYLGSPRYQGEFPGAEVVLWTPNHIVLRGPPGATLTLNMNPSSYWTMNGAPLFPGAREFEIGQPFTVVVPPSGEMDLRASPPGLGRAMAIQAAFAVLALLLVLGSTGFHDALRRLRPLA
jgi:hypothetical protein